MTCCKQCEALQRAIDSCEKELEKIKKGLVPIPEGYQLDENEIWGDIMEERFGYLEGLQSKFQFIRDYPERKMQV